MLRLFFSYSHADEALRDQLQKQLEMLKRQGIIETWHDRRITAGEVIDHAISEQLETADIILLLVSADFIASSYCYDIEMQRALARHEAGEATVIPVILRACDWHHAPFGKLMATPTDGRAVKQWPDLDEAMLDVARAVRKAAEKLMAKAPKATPAPSRTPAIASVPIQPTAPRSSNLRLTKQFTERDKDAFRLETFEYMAKFFENSLAELEQRNPGIEGVFRRIDANRFTAVAYRDGQARARCTIFMGGVSFMRGIAFSYTETDASNSLNENLDVHADDQSMFLRGMGVAHFAGRAADQNLSPEGASEFYWSMFISPLQNR